MMCTLDTRIWTNRRGKSSPIHGMGMKGPFLFGEGEGIKTLLTLLTLLCCSLHT